MSSTINLFMNKELTCLPSLFNKYISKQYNNALGNALTWLFFIWLFLHFAFDRFMNALLYQMKYREYFRQRIISTLWSFGFSFFSFIYCLAILSINNFRFTEIHSFNQFLHEKVVDTVPNQYVVGFVILCTYFAQTALWEGTQNGCNETVYFNLSFVMLFLFTYIKGWSELVFALIFITCLAQSILELSKIFFMQIYSRHIMKKLATFFFNFHCVICFIMYAILLPLQFLIPCGKNFKNEISIHILLLNTLLWIWYILSLSQSAIFKVAKHYVYHMSDFGQTECTLNFLECSMFAPRTDSAFKLGQVKKEIDRRQEVSPNASRNKREQQKLALYQTLKCMVTVKRKLKQRRAANESSPSTSGDQTPSPTSHGEIDESTQIASGIVDELLNNIEIDTSPQEEEVKTTKNE